ncbi:MAG: hypothetical protein IPL33_07310 [Sphingobacteriales bacterium]|nr:hypothetical protein [Sphingobacteriales bacterium]
MARWSVFCICPIVLQAQTAAAKGQIQVSPIIETMLQAYTKAQQGGTDDGRLSGSDCPR